MFGQLWKKKYFTVLFIVKSALQYGCADISVALLPIVPLFSMHSCQARDQSTGPGNMDCWFLSTANMQLSDLVVPGWEEKDGVTHISHKSYNWQNNDSGKLCNCCLNLNL